MRLLLDTHSLLWAVDDPSRLGRSAEMALRDPSNELLLGAGCIWEIAIKVGLNKLSLSLPFEQWVSGALSSLSLNLLPITVPYVSKLTTLAQHHRDPFDRLLVAQAIVDGLPIVSADPLLDPYPITRIW